MSTESSSENSIPTVIEKFIDAYNAMDVSAMMTCLHEDATFENISNYHSSMQWQGAEAIKTLIETSAAAFASRKQSVIQAVCNGNDCALRVEFAGVPLVDLPNGMKAGEATLLRGASFFTLKDGKIYHLTDIS